MRFERGPKIATNVTNPTEMMVRESVVRMRGYSPIQQLPGAIDMPGAQCRQRENIQCLQVSRRSLQRTLELALRFGEATFL